MPLTFNDTGDPVTLTMVDTLDAVFRFASCTPGRTLPAAVTDLTPPTVTMLREGDVVTAPAPSQNEVAQGQGTWTFAGWTPTSATVADANLEFEGCWTYAVNPDAEFAVNYEYRAADASALPADVQATLPAAATAVQGSTVTPETPSQTAFQTVEMDGAATVTTDWTFTGWSPASAVVDGADITFVGTWQRQVTRVDPVDPVDPIDPDDVDVLASTGYEITPTLVIGVSVLASGLALIAYVLIQRRRQKRDAAHSDE